MRILAFFLIWVGMIMGASAGVWAVLIVSVLLAGWFVWMCFRERRPERDEHEDGGIG